MRSCGNKCIFCFVFQNPKGLRKPLYFKDEDYRFSFLFGHYTTLTNATQGDLDRIVEQKLSPLYISVHVTEPKLRKMMLGINFDDHLFEKFDFLTNNGIAALLIVLKELLNHSESRFHLHMCLHHIVFEIMRRLSFLSDHYKLHSLVSS